MKNDNDNSLGQRLRREMKKRNVTGVDLEKMADVKATFIYDVCSGKSANPSSIKLARVAEALGVSLTYLAGTSDSPVDGYQFAIAARPDHVSVQHLFARDGKVSSRTSGVQSFLFHKEQLQALSTAPDELRLHRIEGDNMHPTLQVGDTVMVDTSKRYPTPPGMFMLFDGVGLTVKRVESLPQTQKLRISCDNPHYSAYESRPEDTAIIGRVVWFSRAC